VNFVFAMQSMKMLMSDFVKPIYKNAHVFFTQGSAAL